MQKALASVMCAVVLIGALLAAGLATVQAAVPSMMNYQGILLDGSGNPVTTPVLVVFTIYDAASAGNVQWTEPRNVTPDAAGLININLGEGNPLTNAVFAAPDRWLGIKVGADPEMTPRTRLVTVPYAHRAATVDGGGSAWNTTGNAATTPGTNFLGTTDNQALELKVNNMRVWRAEPDASSPNVVSGWSGNTITSGVHGATIAGGGGAFPGDSSNWVTDASGTVSGGYANRAGNGTGTLYDALCATVGGGRTNIASGEFSTVGGGISNTAAGTSSAVGGGSINTASGGSATVSGGMLNRAQGDFSFAAGYRAKADHAGTFVWADMTMADFASTAANQFLIRASGNVGIGTNAPAQKLDVAGTVQMTGFMMPTGAANGSVLTSNASGVGTWQAAGAAGWSLTGNAGTTPGTSFLGTTDNQALELKVNNSRVWRFEPSGTSPNVLGGYSGNSLTAGVYGATISGGGTAANVNSVTDLYGTVGGGRKNQAGDNAGAVNDRAYATVGGGYANTASDYCATASGGSNDTASGYCATVPGGYLNKAQGDYSFAAGYRAKADHVGTFVWADNTAADFASTGNSQFLIRASGNVGIGTNAPAQKLDVAGTVQMTGFKLPTGAANGSILTSDVSGGGTWQAAPAAGWGLTGNAGTTPGTNFLGTTDNQALELKVNASRVIRLESATNGPNIICGYSGNNITSGASGATIAGGGRSTFENSVTDNYGTVGGGHRNRAGDNAGTTSDREYMTVSGGLANCASGSYSVVGGGQNDTASYTLATVGGGAYNVASGMGATVPGGNSNRAQGNYSLAAGYMARATHNGAFVWSDGSLFTFGSSAVNEFAARATGGVRFVTGIDGSGVPNAGVQVAAGGTSWSAICDRNLKENFASVDAEELLHRVATLPVMTWNAKAQDASIRHIGPVAQDFYAAFGVGEDSTHITTVDADGVALAAIQALYKSNQELARKVAELQARLDALAGRQEGSR